MICPITNIPKLYSTLKLTLLSSCPYFSHKPPSVDSVLLETASRHCQFATVLSLLNVCSHKATTRQILYREKITLICFAHHKISASTKTQSPARFSLYRLIWNHLRLTTSFQRKEKGKITWGLCPFRTKLNHLTTSSLHLTENC